MGISRYKSKYQVDQKLVNSLVPEQGVVADQKLPRKLVSGRSG
jgi:hypothetical protein